MSETESTPADIGKVLTNAAMEGRTEVVRRLLSEMSAGERRKYGPPALAWAAWQGESEPVRALLDAGIAIDPNSSDFIRALHAAASRGKVAVLRLLLDAGANIDARDNARRTALHHVARLSKFASRRDAGEAARLLLERGADANAVDTDGWTPMACASQRGLTEVLRELRAHGVADRISLLDVVESGNLSCVQEVLDTGADLLERDRDGNTALHRAAEGNDARGEYTAILRLLLRRGMDPDGRNKDRLTPLHLAACVGNVAGIEALIEAGADVNANAPEIPPLCFAIWQSNEEAAFALVRHGATAEGLSGDSLVYIALREGMEGLAVLLLNQTGELPPLPRNPRSKTALMLAAEQGFQTAADLLLKLGADPNEVRPRQERSALMYAAARGHSEVVILLLAAGADPNYSISDGRTALALARRSRRTEALRILEGANRQTA